MARYPIVITALAALSMPLPATAQKRPELIKLSPKSDKGAVLIRVPTQPFPYALQFSKNGKSGFLSRVYMMKIDSSVPGYVHVARTLSPGRYRLDNVWQQGAWTACMEQARSSSRSRPAKSPMSERSKSIVC